MEVHFERLSDPQLSNAQLTLPVSSPPHGKRPVLPTTILGSFVLLLDSEVLVKQHQCLSFPAVSPTSGTVSVPQ